jgi:signal peptidase I
MLSSSREWKDAILRYQTSGGGWDGRSVPPGYGSGAPGVPPQTGQREPIILRPQGPLLPAPEGGDGNDTLKKLGLAGWSAIMLIPFLILLLIFLALVFIGRPYIVHGSSMFPTLSDGDRVFVVPYRGNTTPDRGDVVVLRDLAGTNEMLIKRVVAISGDKLYMGNGEVVVNDQFRYKSSKTPPQPVTELVPDGKLFVMGDNEGHSYDSRTFGPVEQGNVVGKALFIFWPPADLRKL